MDASLLPHGHPRTVSGDPRRGEPNVGALPRAHAGGSCSSGAPALTARACAAWCGSDGVVSARERVTAKPSVQASGR